MKIGIARKLQRARVARLATADGRGRPHVVPVCFAYDGRAFYTPVDLKPKRAAPDKLARVHNIQANPNVAFLIDDYREDWSRLWFVLVRGTARLLRRGKEHRKAHRLLRRKYRQYAGGLLPTGAPVIRIRPLRISPWGRF